jgi:hypothetical protein
MSTAIGIGMNIATAQGGGFVADIYTDYENGNDTTGDGSSESPYKTLSKAFTVASSGNIIGVRGSSSDAGIYREQNLTVPAGITIQNDTDHTPHVTTADRYASGAWSKTVGQTNVYEATVTTNCLGVCNGSQELTLAGNLAACDATANSYYFNNPADTLYVNIGGGAPGNIDVTETAQQVLVMSNAGSTVNGLTFWWGARMIGISANSTIKNCTFERLTSYDTGVATIEITAGTAHTVDNCTFTHESRECISVKHTTAGSGLTVSNCTSSGAYQGVNITIGTGHIISDCTIHDTINNAIHFQGAGITGTVQDCTIYNFGNVAVQSKNGSDVTCLRVVAYVENTNYGHDSAFSCESNSALMTCYHCIAYGLRDDSAVGTGAGFYPHGSVGSNDMTVKNCAAIRCIHGLYAESDGGFDANDYNDYYQNESSNITGGEMGSNSITTDPSFTDAANGDFTLQAGSLNIDAGVAIEGINDDYLGDAPDIGAYEKA